MLNISVLEVGVVLLVGLLVIGPKRLPRVARQMGKFFAKCQQLWHNLQKKSDEK